MNMKFLGAVLILISGSMIGWVMASTYGKRVKNLKNLQTGINMFNAEIEYTRTALPRALSKTAKKCRPPVADFFAEAGKQLQEDRERLFFPVWRSILKNKGADSCLKSEEIQVLLEWSRQISGTTLKICNQANKITVERLKEIEERARIEAGKKVKLLRYGGVLISLLIIILFY